MNKDKLKSILNKDLNPLNLAREKYNAYRQHIIDVLHDVCTAFDKEEYDKIFEMTAVSSSGDGYYGDDNHYIDFGYDDAYPDDIIKALNLLLYYRAIFEQKIPVTEKFRGNYYFHYYSKDYEDGEQKGGSV